MVGKGSVAGLDVERALFKAVEARFLVSLNLVEEGDFHAWGSYGIYAKGIS